MKENLPDTMDNPVSSNDVTATTNRQLVERKTALRGASICRPEESKRSRRRRTHLVIYDKDPEVPYEKFEAAHRDLICSLMERQDRMNEEIFAKIVDLEYRVNELELELGQGL
ncbi:MAG: hypothetical protein GYA23_10935 [Methanomicrobiales archaeon]|nr:hypothetical protein [Methanomicrobiales archaeon]